MARHERVGLFGGTFNPIHVGHLLLAERAREQLRLDRVLFIPTAVPPHKDPSALLPGPDRLAMIRAAVRRHPGFEASDVELRRGGVSYTVDTVEDIRRRRPSARLYLLVGADMLTVRWRAWEALIRRCTVVAAGRPGARRVRRRGVRWIAMPAMAVSSSEIRARVAAGQSIHYLVPEAVERLILRRGWYRGRGREA